MIKSEFEKTIANKFLYILIIVLLLMYGLGYIMPMSLDKVHSLAYRPLLSSIYTVFTQFGPMMFPFLIAYSISKDYSDRTGLFYRSLGINSLKYIISKLTVFAMELAGIVLIYNFILSLIYHDFSAYIQMSLLFTIVGLSTFCLVSLLSLIFSSLILAIRSSLFIWILSIVVAQAGGILQKIAFFDSSTSFHQKVSVYLDSNYLIIQDGFWTPILYIIVVICITLILSKLFNCRFFRLGVEG
ncbi:MAG: hypothetical protein FWE43_01155 [Streptococcaceae bacterium]|nr:hypothetical protein [Streptococcaceae bacterium]MCL2681085.1 hypothetical protein [Streptococcaceae bacterium]